MADFPTRYAGPEASPGYLLWRASNLWQRRIRAALEPLGITHVQFVLLASLGWLTRNGQSVNQTDLAWQAGTDVMMTSQVLRALQARGLVERERDPGDARAFQVRPSAEGLEVIARALPAVEGADEAFFAAAGERRKGLVDGLRSVAGL
jgi:DNA-binding MarR family transcriptional regulator